MKTYKELLNSDNSWEEVQDLISKAQNQVTVLSCDKEDGIKALEHLQISNKSYLGQLL